MFWILPDYTRRLEICRRMNSIIRNQGINFRSNVDMNWRKLFQWHDIGGLLKIKPNPEPEYYSDIWQNVIDTTNAFPVYNPNNSYGGNFIITQSMGRFIGDRFLYFEQEGVQVTLEFKQKLDIITKGLSISGAISFNNNFMSYSTKSSNTWVWIIER